MVWRQPLRQSWGCILVLVLVLVDTVCVGGERFVGGVVGAAQGLWNVELH
jgi:hypothetical protein